MLYLDIQLAAVEPAVEPIAENPTAFKATGMATFVATAAREPTAPQSPRHLLHPQARH